MTQNKPDAPRQKQILEQTPVVCPKCGRETLSHYDGGIRPTGKRVCMNIFCPQRPFWPERLEESHGS